MATAERPKRIITIASGTMLNRGNHEDDDYLVLTRDVQATVVGRRREGGLPVVVPDFDPSQTLFLHQPGVKRHSVKK